MGAAGHQGGFSGRYNGSSSFSPRRISSAASGTAVRHRQHVRGCTGPRTDCRTRPGTSCGPLLSYACRTVLPAVGPAGTLCAAPRCPLGHPPPPPPARSWPAGPLHPWVSRPRATGGCGQHGGDESVGNTNAGCLRLLRCALCSGGVTLQLMRRAVVVARGNIEITRGAQLQDHRCYDELHGTT